MRVQREMIRDSHLPLPEARAPFFGRHDELALLARLLADPSARIITLVGVGKTRLAFQAARQVRSIEAVYFAPLAAVASPDRVDDDRYDLHELLRQYGGEHLARDVAVQAEVERRHALYRLAYLNRCARDLFGPAQKAMLDALAADLDNLRTALSWLRHHPSEFPVEPGLHALWFYFDTRGRYHEGERFFAALLDRPGDTPFHAGVLAGHGAMCFPLNRPAESLAHLQRALSIQERFGAVRDAAFCLSRIGIMRHYQEGQMDDARQHFEQSLMRYRVLGDIPGMVTALNWLGKTRIQQGAFDEALQHITEALNFAQQIGDFYYRASALVEMGSLMLIAGRAQKARVYFQEALDLFQALGVGWGIVTSQRALGIIAMTLKQYAEARRHFRETLITCHSLGLTSEMTIFYCAKLFALQGDLDYAVELFTVSNRLL
jgi:tetratricopeptide (TPR) repeat protein